MSTYWLQYGLPRDPFATSEPGNYFSIPQWQQEIELLQHMVQFSNVMIIVSGAAGVGKTVFKHQFEQKIKNNVELVSIDAEANMDLAYVQQALRQHLQLPALDNMSAQVDHLQQENRTALLVIDDAHRLSPELLNALLETVKLQSQTHKTTALHVLLVGDDSFNKQINALKDNFIVDGKQLIHHSELEPLNLQQIIQYLEFRLNIAGFTDVLPFNNVDLEDIRKYSKGFISAINERATTILQEKLQMQAVTRNHSQRNKLYLYITGGVLVVLLVAIAGAVTLNTVSNRSEPNPVQIIEIEKPAIEDTQSELLDLETFSAEPMVTDIDLVEAPIAPIEVAAELSLDVSENLSESKNEVLLENVVNIEVQKEPDVLLNQEPTAEETAQALEQTRQHYAPIEKPPVVLDKVVVVPEVKAAAAAPEPKPELKPEPAPVQAEQVVAEEPVVIATQPEVLIYGLQILGTSNKQALASFIATYKLETNAKAYETQLNGKAWYILLYGQYDSKEKARATIAQLPSAIQNLKPWPRTLAELKPVTL